MDVTKALEAKRLLRPKRLTLSLTTNCNLHCEHCWVECEGSAGHGVSAPTDGIRRLLNEFVAIGGEEVCLTGGEPFMHPDVVEILSCGQELGVRKLHVQTNATLLTDAVFKALAALDPRKLNFQVSLDGGTAATHDLVRGSGSFKRAVCGIEQLVAHGYGERTVIGFTEMRHNLHDVPELLRLVAQLGVAEVVGWSIVAHGKALKTQQVSPPLPAQYIRLLELYHSDQGFRTLYDQHGCFAAIEWFKGRDQSGGQLCRFIEKPYVSASGALYPCVLLQQDAYAAFNLYDRPLVDAIEEKIADWVSLRDRTIARSNELKRCKGCAGAHHCAGGCFARALPGADLTTCVEDRCRLRRAVYAWCPPD